MSENIVLSIIVPIYNVEPYLEKCLKSICDILCPRVEVILVDDGSKDRSGDICDKYAALDVRIQVVHKENGGLVSARKAGVDIAKGKYITFVDGDDWIDAAGYDKLIQNYLNKYMPMVLAFGCVEEYENSTKIQKNLVEENFYIGEQLEYLKREILSSENFFEWNILPHLCDKFIEKNLLIKHIYKVPDVVTFGEDAACSFPCMMEADTICVSNESPYHYRQREDSIVHLGEELPKQNFISIYSLLKEALTKDYGMQIQLKKYMFFLLLLKKYSLISDIMPLVPYAKVQHNERIFIYGAGGFGKVIKQFVEKSESLELVGWTDAKAEIYRKNNMKINVYEDVFRLEKEYDHVIIAILNERVAESIKLDFINKGIPEEKIDWVRGKVVEVLQLPSWLENNVIED